MSWLVTELSRLDTRYFKSSDDFGTDTLQKSNDGIDNATFFN